MGFKRGAKPSLQPKENAKVARTSEDGGIRGRNRGRGRGSSNATRGGQKGKGTRGKKRTSDEMESDRDSSPEQTRKHVLYEDDEDDIQGEYREEGGTTVGDIWIPPKFTRVEVERTGERLVIEKIVCENFKSYGGVKEMGPFHKSFSAIVGPNGNGKSNIIDAMLFVFGYRATKIRCKKISVLIHKSELLPNLTSCAVTVHFVRIVDNGLDDESFDIVPDTRITVTRRADDKNSSVYLLDGKTVKFQEVASFLKANGIDIVHNRFLILQGEVESIAQMPPKRKGPHDTGLLEFLEDVIGTKRYLRSLVALEERVETLNFKRETHLQIVDIAEKEKNSLKEPVRKAKDYLRTANSVARSQHKIYQWKSFEARKQLAGIEDGKKDKEHNLKGIKLRLKEIEGLNTEKDVALATHEKETRKLEMERDRMKTSLDAAEAEYSKNTEQLKRTNVQRKKAIKDLNLSEKELEELDLIPSTHEGNVKQLGDKRVELDEKIEIEEKNVEKDMGKLQVKVDAVSKEKEGIDKKFMQLKKVRDQKKVTSETLVSELKVYMEQEDVERRKFETIKEDVESLKEKVKHKEREARSSIGNNIGPLEESLKAKTEESRALIEQERGTKTTFEQLQTAYAGAREAFEGSAVNDQIYKAFFGEKNRGRLQGLYGRLKDLAKIDPKYNVAVTVSNHLWEHWVCDNDTTAEECINTLKAKGLVYQNFICLNKLTQQMQQMKRPFNPPQGSLRLFDLLQFNKPEVAPAFYKACRDTIVVDNLDVAQKIAYGSGGGYRVTTLRGDIIDPNGAMTGGGRQQIVGKMNTGMSDRLENSVSPEEFARIKRDFEKASKEFEDVCSRRQTLDQEIRQLTVKVKDLKGKVDSSKTDIESMKTQLRLKEGRLQEQEAKLKDCIADPKVVKEKESACKKAQKEFEAANAPCEASEEEAKEVEVKLKFLQVEKKREIRKKLDFLIEQRKKVIEDYNKFSIALTNYPKTKAKLEKRIETLKEDIKRYQEKILSLDATKKTIQESSEKTNTELAVLTEKAGQARKELEKLKKTHNEFHKEKVELEKTEAHISNELSNIENNCKAYTSQLKNFAAQIEKLELSPIPEEELAPFEILTDEQLVEMELKDLEHKVDKYSKRLKKEQPNLGVLQEYKRKVDEFIAKVEELDEITLNRDMFRTAYIKTTAQRLAEFMEGFAIISSKLKEMFRMISMGGDAELELVDSTDPFTFGIEISVRPARKTWKKISFLSGGEKTLSSLALVFALHHFKPSPFYVMDEIDAALDFKNVSIIANYIKDRTKFTQFIIISLRSNMFELADSMLGVYKVDNMSYSIHLGIGKLLLQLKSKFAEHERPFPFTNDYLQNNRLERRRAIEAKEKAEKAKEDSFRKLNFSLIREGEEEEEIHTRLEEAPKRKSELTTNSTLGSDGETVRDSQGDTVRNLEEETVPDSQPPPGEVVEDRVPDSQPDTDKVPEISPSASKKPRLSSNSQGLNSEGDGDNSSEPELFPSSSVPSSPGDDSIEMEF